MNDLKSLAEKIHDRRLSGRFISRAPQVLSLSPGYPFYADVGLLVICKCRILEAIQSFKIALLIVVADIYSPLFSCLLWF